MEKCLEGRKELKEIANMLNSSKCPQRSESKQKQVKCQKLDSLKSNKHNRFLKNPQESPYSIWLSLGSSLRFPQNTKLTESSTCTTKQNQVSG